jgi:predicted small secreted protein
VTMHRLAVLGLVLMLAGCGTVEGMGRDISDGAVAVRSWFR